MSSYIMIVEIPKGDTRRRHLKYNKSGFIDLGPLIDAIPLNKGIMPVHYGFIPNTSNTQEGDDVDVLLLSDRSLEVGQEINIKPIAFIKRDDEDNKVVATDLSNKYSNWEELPDKERALIIEYFGYNHKILGISSKEDAIDYIERSKG